MIIIIIINVFVHTANHSSHILTKQILYMYTYNNNQKVKKKEKKEKSNIPITGRGLVTCLNCSYLIMYAFGQVRN